MTDNPTEPTATADEPRARRRAATPNFYGEALAHLERANEILATNEISPDVEVAARAALVQASSAMLVANEARVANLISWFGILRTTRELTQDGRDQMGELDRRIRAALGIDETAGA